MEVYPTYSREYIHFIKDEWSVVRDNHQLLTESANPVHRHTAELFVHYTVSDFMIVHDVVSNIMT